MQPPFFPQSSFPPSFHLSAFVFFFFFFLCNKQHAAWTVDDSILVFVLSLFSFVFLIPLATSNPQVRYWFDLVWLASSPPPNKPLWCCFLYHHDYLFSLARAATATVTLRYVRIRYGTLCSPRGPKALGSTVVNIHSSLTHQPPAPREIPNTLVLSGPSLHLCLCAISTLELRTNHRTLLPRPVTFVNHQTNRFDLLLFFLGSLVWSQDSLFAFDACILLAAFSYTSQYLEVFVAFCLASLLGDIASSRKSAHFFLCLSMLRSSNVVGLDLPRACSIFLFPTRGGSKHVPGCFKKREKTVLSRNFDLSSRPCHIECSTNMESCIGHRRPHSRGRFPVFGFLRQPDTATQCLAT